MGRQKTYHGVKPSEGKNTISVRFTYPYGKKRQREFIKLEPTPANLELASLHLRQINIAIKNGTFDYVALGVNEIEQIFQQQVVPLGGISIAPSLMLYYPFPLVFYVNPDKPSLAERVKKGLNRIITNGEFEVLFEHYHGDIVQRLNLRNREIFTF